MWLGPTGLRLAWVTRPIHSIISKCKTGNSCHKCPWFVKESTCAEDHLPVETTTASLNRWSHENRFDDITYFCAMISDSCSDSPVPSLQCACSRHRTSLHRHPHQVLHTQEDPRNATTRYHTCQNKRELFALSLKFWTKLMISDSRDVIGSPENNL